MKALLSAGVVLLGSLLRGEVPLARGFDFAAEVPKGTIRLTGGIYTNAAMAAEQATVDGVGWHLSFDRSQMAPRPNWCTVEVKGALQVGDWQGRTVLLVMRRRPFRNVTKQMAINFTDRDGETFQFLPESVEEDAVENTIACRFRVAPSRFSGCWGGGEKANKRMDLPIRFTSLNGHFASPVGKGEMTLVRIDVEKPLQEVVRTVSFVEPISTDTTYPGAKPFPAAEVLEFRLTRPYAGTAKLTLFANSRGSAGQGDLFTFSTTSDKPTTNLSFKVDLPVGGQYEFGRLTDGRGEALPIGFAEGRFLQSMAEAMRLDVETGNRLHLVRSERSNESPVLTIFNPTQQPCHWKTDFRFQDVFGRVFTVPFDRTVAAGETVRVPVPTPLPAKGLWFVRADVTGDDGSHARHETRFAWIDNHRRTAFLEKPKFRFGIHYHGTYYLPDLVDPTIEAMVAAGAKFTRTDYSFMFSDIFPTEAAVEDPSQRKWAQADDLLKRLRAAGLSLEIIIGGTPSWAVDREHLNACKGLRRQGCHPSRPGLFRTFCQAFAERYGRQIDYYEIGNEWDIVPKQILTIDEALRMQREAYEGVHAGCPDACVTPNGWAFASSRNLSTEKYSTGMIEAFARHPELYDAWSLHCHGAFEGYVARLQGEFLPMQEETGLKKRPWISGETAQTTFGGDEILVGRTVWAKILYAWAWGARDYIWYNLRATGWLEGSEPGYGLMTASLHPRAGYASFAALTTIFQGLDADGRMISTDDLSLFRFKGETDSFKGIVLAGWKWKAERPHRIRIKTDAVSAMKSDYMGNRKPLHLENGEIDLDLEDDPQAFLLTGATWAVQADSGAK